MKAMLFEKEKGSGNRNIIELFGLPKSGKSYLLEKLRKQGNRVFDYKTPNAFNKFLLFIKYLIKHPIKTSRLFYKLNSNWLKLENLTKADYWLIFRTRNSYLAAVLAKYEYLRLIGFKAYVDEYIFQSLFMILQKKSNKEEIKAVLDLLPPSGKILLLEESKKIRYERWNKIKNPARNLSLKFRMKWWEINEYNFSIIVKMLREKFGPVENIRIQT